MIFLVFFLFNSNQKLDGLFRFTCPTETVQFEDVAHDGVDGGRRDAKDADDAAAAGGTSASDAGHFGAPIDQPLLLPPRHLGRRIPFKKKINNNNRIRMTIWNYIDS